MRSMKFLNLEQAEISNPKLFTAKQKANKRAMLLTTYLSFQSSFHFSIIILCNYFAFNQQGDKESTEVTVENGYKISCIYHLPKWLVTEGSHHVMFIGLYKMKWQSESHRIWRALAAQKTVINISPDSLYNYTKH